MKSLESDRHGPKLPRDQLRDPMPGSTNWLWPISARGADSPLDQAKLILSLASALLAGYAAILIVGLRAHFWILDARGRPTVQDFGAFWSAGALALRHMAAAAYDPGFEQVAHLVREARGFADVLEWSYPPVFFFVAVVLASMPYALAFAAWVVATLAIHAGIVGAIARRPSAMILAAAAPWTIFCAISGQNGFFTASLAGLVLLNLETRPAVAGIVLGLLSCKPQLALLFPVALAFGGYRRAFLWACVSTLALTVLSCWSFGVASFSAFLSRLPATAESHLVMDWVGWSKLQSLYGALRWLGVENSIAWQAQLALSIACTATIALLWRSRLPFELKAAALSVAAILVTPYVFIYDLPVLSVGIAFLYRQRRFDRVEFGLFWLSLPGFALFGWHSWPVGLLAASVVGVLLLRRCQDVRSASALPALPHAAAPV